MPVVHTNPNRKRGPASCAIVVTMALSLTGFAAQPPYQDAPPALPPGGDRAETQSPQRLPVPEADALERAAAKVRSLYKKDFARAPRTPQRLALGRKLLDEATATDDDPLVRFALLREARDLGVELARPELILASIDEMGKRYRIDAPEMKAERLKEAAGAARTTTARRAIAEACLALVDDAVVSDRFAVAMEHARTAYDAADKAGDKRLRDEIVVRGKQVLALEKEFQRVQEAEKTLADNSDDPEANLIRGRSLSLVKRDWDHGLPMLAKGSDPQWQALAQKDLANPSDPQARLALGDAWWEMAQAKTELARGSLLARARRWYQAAMPRLSGADKTRVIARLAEIKGYGTGIVQSGEPREPAEPAASGPSSPPGLVPGEWSELLTRIDVEKHTASPAWRLRGTDLEVEPTGPAARLAIPVVPEGAYDLRIELTRTDGFGMVGVILPVGPRQCLLALGYGGTASGLDTVGSRRADDNTTTFLGALNNNRRYTLEVTVRLDADQAAVTANLDGRPLVFYRGPVRSLGLDDDWRIPRRDCLGLVAQSPAVFHSVRLKPVAGKAKMVE